MCVCMYMYFLYTRYIIVVVVVVVDYVSRTEMYLCMYWGICGIFVVVVCTFCSQFDTRSCLYLSFSRSGFVSSDSLTHSLEQSSLTLALHFALDKANIVSFPFPFLNFLLLSLSIRNVRKFQLNLIWIDLYIYAML